MLKTTKRRVTMSLQGENEVFEERLEKILESRKVLFGNGLLGEEEYQRVGRRILRWAIRSGLSRESVERLSSAIA